MVEKSHPLNAFVQADLVQQDPLPIITANRIRGMIVDGKLNPGTRLPNEVDLASAMGISRGTVRAALSLLEQQGLIWRRQGLGSFVNERPILDNRLDLNNGVTDLIKSMGFTPGTIKQEIKVVPADPQTARPFNLPEGTPFIFIHRIRTANERPVVSSFDYFPQSFLEKSFHRINVDELGQALEKRQSLYQVFECDLAISIDHGIAQIKPLSVDRRIIQHTGLDLRPSSVVLYLEQLDFDRDRNPVILSQEYHVADFCTFTIYRRP